MAVCCNTASSIRLIEMKEYTFYKFDGAGNDFVLIDDRQGEVDLSAEQISHICHRRSGVGADGLMLMQSCPEGFDFRMRYFNSDGHPASMCGNGGRCIAMFAHMLQIAGNQDCLRFLADDGPHEAVIVRWDGHHGVVRLGMRDVPESEVSSVLDGKLLNTGVPHYVQQVDNLDEYDVVANGRRLRFHEAMGEDGANINFVEPMADGVLKVRTYERGVEDETWACGTGVTACAIATGVCRLKAVGGDFEVSYCHADGCYSQVFLQGPVSLNFTGKITI